MVEKSKRPAMLASVPLFDGFNMVGIWSLRLYMRGVVTNGESVRYITPAGESRMNDNSGRAGRATRARFRRKRCLRVELARYDGAPVG